MTDKLKTFFLHHGEKLGFGLVAVVALFVLWGTRWSPYEKTPQKLIQDAENAKTTIANSIWPDERKQELIPTKDIMARAQALRGGVDSKPFAFSTSIYAPIYERNEPILPPKFLAPEDMIADADVVLIETPPEQDDPLLEEGDDEAATDDEDDQSEIPEGLRTRDDRPSTPGYMEGLETPGSGCGGGELPPDYDGGISPECGGEYYGEMGTRSVSRNGEGFRFVSIRSVIDWAAQKREYARALHLPPNEAARAEPLIIDFEIQRQRAVSEENPWSGEWEALNPEHSANVLKKAIEFEADVVDVTVTNSVITEPLPRRVLGRWKSWATHPRITNFVLSPEEQELEQMRIARLREYYEQQKQNQPQQPLQERGWKRFQVDVRSMQNELRMGGDTASMEQHNAQYAQDMQKYYGNNRGNGGPRFQTGGRPGGEPDLFTSARSAASGKLLLFRYFDFDVEPGAIYRYRVRIVYANPNYAKPIELLASPELAEGQTRTSDWSEPTPPVQVRPQADYYLTGVEYESKLRSDVAAMDLYKWNAPTGTVVNQLKRYSVGDEIGGVVDTKVVNPLDETYEGQDIKVNTGDVVIDFRNDDDLKIDGDLPDLGTVPDGVRFDEVLVMNSHGNLRTYDRFTRESERVKAKRYQKFQDDIGKDYEEAAKEAESADDLLGIYGECGGGEGGEYGSGGGRRRPSSASSTRPRRRSYGGGP